LKLSDEASISDRQKRKVRIWGTLALILAVGLGIRYIFYTGMVRGDSLNYAHAAFLRSQGISDLGNWAGVGRIGLYGPVAFLYALFGPGELATHAYPLFASMATMFFLFKIGELANNQRTGLVAALLWAFFPLDIHLSTSLLPDVPVTTFMTGALYFFLKGTIDQKLLSWNYLAALFLILLGILVKPIAIMGLISAAILIIYTHRESLAAWIATLLEPLNMTWRIVLQVATILAAIFGLRWYSSIQPYPFLATLAKTASDLSGFFVRGVTELEISNLRLDFSSLLLFFAPLYTISVLWVLRNGNRNSRNLLVWTIALFLYYEWGTISTDPLFYIALQPFNEARNFLFLVAPLTVIVAIYIERFMHKNGAERALQAVALIGLATAWLLRTAHWNSTPIWLWAATLAIPIFALASVVYEDRLFKLPNWSFAGPLLLLIFIAFLRPVAPYHSSWYWDRIDRLEMLRSAAEQLAGDATTPIYLKGRGNAMTLNFASNFELGFDWLDEEGESASAYRISNALPDGRHYQIVFGESNTDSSAQLFGTFQGNYGSVLTVWLHE
jgi:hypothetical protein